MTVLQLFSEAIKSFQSISGALRGTKQCAASVLTTGDLTQLSAAPWQEGWERHVRGSAAEALYPESMSRQSLGRRRYCLSQGLSNTCSYLPQTGAQMLTRFLLDGLGFTGIPCKYKVRFSFVKFADCKTLMLHPIFLINFFINVFPLIGKKTQEMLF